jgi:hydrogenase expression/formation protein HypE
MACEILGLDALYVANEGRFIAIVHPADAERALSVLSQFTVSAGATVIGRVEPLGAGQVALRTKLGTVRALDMLSGEQLPRIC